MNNGRLSIMRQIHFTLLAIFVVAGCGRDERQPPGKPPPGPGGPASLTEARRGFKTKLPPRQGAKEGFLGEVDDVLAAADYLGKQEFVDAKRIYLGGHSTGGTLVLLVAECSERFRAVFSFGPADDVAGYGPEYLPFDTSNRREIE